MSIKKEIKDIKKGINNAEKEIKKDIGKGINEAERDIKHAEKWMFQRRKFLIKLGFVIGFVALLLIISHFYLRIKGVGV